MCRLQVPVWYGGGAAAVAEAAAAEAAAADLAAADWAVADWAVATDAVYFVYMEVMVEMTLLEPAHIAFSSTA